jgi:hypothetical protein
MTIIIIIGLVIIGIYFLSRGQSSNKQISNNDSEPKEKRVYSEIRKYERERLFYKLKGVAFENRTDAYDEVESGVIVHVRFDNNNKFDKNAIGVYTESGKLLGYIERDQRRLIKTLRDNPNNLGYVAEKIFVAANGEYKNPYRGIELEIWVGFPDTELHTEKQKRIDRKKFYELSELLDLKLSIAKETRDTNPMEAIKILEEVSETMTAFNNTSVDDKKFKIPLNDLTILTNKQGLFEKTVFLCNRYLQTSNLTERQKEEILKREEKANERLS